MNARFAELCRSQHLELVDVEGPISRAAQEDGRTERDRLLNCDKDIYIGVFFDGTNNNKYRDTPGLSQSNIARLYEVYPGTPASQTPPVLRPRILPDGTKNDRTPFSDQPFKSDSVQAADFPYYRKITSPVSERRCPTSVIAARTFFVQAGSPSRSSARSGWLGPSCSSSTKSTQPFSGLLWKARSTRPESGESRLNESVG